jgi:ATP-dependent Clp protease ATP-binding subunit ClpB
MNIEKLTSKSQEVLQKAQVIAEGNGQQAIETGHLIKRDSGS